MSKPDDFALLSAIWILASNDERNLMTYRGIRRRLRLPQNYDLELLICSHGELFRLLMPDDALNQWKQEMHAGRSLPSWLRDLPPAERSAQIDALKSEDGFRSQFRAATQAPRSDVVVIEWGLGHIERLRKAQGEARAATATSWQMWLVFATSFLGVLATIIAAYITVKYGQKT